MKKLLKISTGPCPARLRTLAEDGDWTAHRTGLRASASLSTRPQATSHWSPCWHCEGQHIR